MTTRSPATNWEFLDHPGPIPFAHRGGARESPENTFTAFRAAIELGYRYLEIDVHATADDVCAVVHDPFLERLIDRPVRVRDMRWADVRRIDADGESVPRLEDVLGAWPQARLNIDAKEDAVVEPLVDALRRAGAFSRVCLASFSGRRLVEMRRLTDDRACTVLGIGDVARLRAGSWGIPVRPKAGQAAQVPTGKGPVPLVDERLVGFAHDLGLHVHVWTIDEADEMRRLLDLGVDGIMTDCPTVLRDVLRERGEWR